MSYYKRLVNANKRATAKCMSISLPAMMKVQAKGKKQCDGVKLPTNILMQTAVTDEKRRSRESPSGFQKLIWQHTSGKVSLKHNVKMKLLFLHC